MPKLSKLSPNINANNLGDNQQPNVRLDTDKSKKKAASTMPNLNQDQQPNVNLPADNLNKDKNKESDPKIDIEPSAILGATPITKNNTGNKPASTPVKKKHIQPNPMTQPLANKNIAATSLATQENTQVLQAALGDTNYEAQFRAATDETSTSSIVITDENNNDLVEITDDEIKTTPGNTADKVDAFVKTAGALRSGDAIPGYELDCDNLDILTDAVKKMLNEGIPVRVPDSKLTSIQSRLAPAESQKYDQLLAQVNQPDSAPGYIPK